MVRPRKIRSVNFEPGITYFKPRAVPLSELEEIELTIDELETMRLSHLEKMDQKESAERMKIHQSTFQRTLARGREKVTDALVNGKAIKINGGKYTMPGKDGTGPIGQRHERKYNGNGPGGVCVCPNCKHEQPHIQGQPCTQTKCEKCGSFMSRI